MLSFTKMRLMDRNLGGLLCRCFAAINWLNRRRRGRLQQEPLRLQKILVMKYFGMGSLILASPMVRALRRRFPDARIDLLTIEQNRSLAEILPIFDNVHTVNTRGVASVLVSMMKALRKIRSEKYDAVIDAEFFSRLSSLVSYFTRAHYSVGFFLPEIWRGNFLTHPVHFNYYRHATLAFLALAKSLGAEAEDCYLEPLIVPDEVQQKVQDDLQRMGAAWDQRIVCVNVNTGPLSPERRWPEENFAELIRAVVREFPDVMIVLIGAPCDLPLVTKLHDILGEGQKKRALNVAGRFDLPELCALLRISELLITNDSGPLHLAAALGIPTVSLFGPETPLLYGAAGEHHVVFYKGIYCSPCLNVQNQKQAPCNGNNICMKLISPDEVFASTRSILRGLPISSPFGVSIDVSDKKLLVDYRSRELEEPFSSEEALPVTVLRK